MKTLSNLLGGLAGAIALNILHESYKRLDHEAPRVDLVGEEAINKGLKSLNVDPLTGNTLYAATLAGDVASNALYYSMIGIGDKKNVLIRGAVFGLVAGVGAVTSTKPLGLSDAPVTKTDKTKLLTVAWYLFGGLITGLTLKALPE